MSAAAARVGIDAAIDALRAVGKGEGLWTDAARHVCRVVGADAASVLVWRGDRQDFRIEMQEGFGFDDGLVREYAQHYCPHDVLVQTYPSPGDWYVSNERFPDAQWSRHPFFGDFLHRWRIRQIAALALHAADGTMAALTLHRHSRSGIVAEDFRHGELARLTQEAERAFETRYGAVVAARCALDAALTDEDSVAFLADATGRVLSLAPGQPLREMPPLAFHRGHVFHPAERARRRLLDLLHRAASGRRGSAAVPGFDGPLRVEARPLPLQAKLAGNQELALVRVSQRGPASLANADELADYFGLTPAQARVLRLLCEGATASDCAEQLCCTEATVRSHVAQLMLRMECSRQAQLVRAAMMLMM